MSLTQSSPSLPARERLPFVVYVLGAGAFLVGTSELLVAGLLPQVARDFDVTIPQAGLMVTVFAIGSIVDPPLTLLLTLQFPRRLTLALALVLFAVAQVVVAVSPHFGLTLAARFVAAVATGSFWAMAAVVAADIAGPGASSRAIGLVVAGGTLANIFGVPLGSFAGQLIGWHGPFWALAVIAALAAFVVFRLVPNRAPGAAPASIKAELGVLKVGRLWVVLVICAFVTGGTLSIYSYIAPLLTLRTGLPESAIPAALVGFGVFSVIGTVVAGRLGDAHPYRTIIGAASISIVTITLLGVTSRLPIPALALFALLGLTGASINPVLMALALKFGNAGPTLASALAPSAFNVGIAICTAVTGVLFGTSIGPLGAVVVGVVSAALVVALAAVLLLSVRRGERANAILQ